MNKKQFGRWSTSNLVSVAHRVTPVSEHPDWIATNRDKGEWMDARDEPGFKCYKAGKVTDEMDEDEMRENVVEQLQHYKTSEEDVNRMNS
jgi:hypothetical protein